MPRPSKSVILLVRVQVAVLKERVKMKAFWVDDSPKITVYSVQVEGLCGPVVWDKLDDAIEEVKSHLGEYPEEIEKITITIGAMSQYEFDSLEEFEGY